MAKIFEPNYTQVPNAILDGMAEFSEPELRVILVVCRQTFGWHRERAALSQSFLAKASGLSGPACSKAGSGLVEKGILEKGKQPGSRGSNTFRLVVNDLSSTIIGGKVDLSTRVTGQAAPPITDDDTNKERLPKKEDAAPAPPPVETEHQKFMRLWKVAYETKFGRAYKFNGGRDGKAVQTLLDEPGATAEDLMDMVERAWKKPDKFWCGKLCAIHQLETHWNEIQFELNNETNGNHRAQSSGRNVGTLNEGRGSQYRGVGRVVPLPDAGRSAA
jgi:phage replication O-like protein O